MDKKTNSRKNNKSNKSKSTNDFMKALYAAVGIGTATDVTTPEKDKEILRKRLIEKHVKSKKLRLELSKGN